MDLTSDHPFWSLLNGIPVNYSPMAHDARCEVLIIGAGITGALVAEALTDDGRDVMVIDSRDVCHGSTSASTALLQYEVDTHLTDLIARHGRAAGESAYRACHDSIDRISEIITRLGIECSFRRVPSVYLASAPEDVGVLREECAARRRMGIDVTFAGSSEIAGLLGIARAGALISEQGATVDAYRLAHGLLGVACSRGARVHDRVKALRISHAEDGVTVTTDRGTRITARHLVVACGYEAQELFTTDRFVSLHSSFAVATEPLSEDGSWWRDCLIWETARPYFYLRPGPDGRAIIGGEDMPFRNAHARDAAISAKGKALMGKFLSMFPRSSAECAYAWSGTFGETEDGLAYIGRLPEYPGCWFALGYGGNGITYSQVAADVIRAGIGGASHEFARTFRFGR